jgi:hypothetical protein
MNGTSFISFPVGSTGDITLSGDNDLIFPVGSTGDVVVNGANNMLFAGSGRVDMANNEVRMNGTSFLNFPVGSTGDITLSGGNDVFVAGTGRVDFANNEQRMNGTSFISFPVGSTGDITLSGNNDINFPAGSNGDILLSGANDLMVAGTGRVNLANNEQRMNGTSFLNFPAGSTGDVTLAGANDIVFSGTGIINMGNNKITNLADATAATDALNMQTGDSRYINVTGDSMNAGAAFTMADGNVILNLTSGIVFNGTGQIAMNGNKITNLGGPTVGTDAANKAYVDGFVSGIVFITPVKDPNIYNDALDTPPGSPIVGYRSYIVKPSAFTITGRTTGASGKWIISGNHAARFAAGNTFVVSGNSDGPSNATYTVASAADVSATTEITISGSIPGTAGTNGTVYHSVGAWNGKDGHAMVWNGTVWVDILGRAVASGDRFAIYAEPDNDELPVDTAGMTATLITNIGKIGTIQAAVTSPGFTALGTAGAWSFYTPVEPDAFSVTGTNSYHYGHSYTFRGTYGSGTYGVNYRWIEFSGPSSIIDGAGLEYTGNTLNIGAGNAITVGADIVSVSDNPILPGTASVTINTGTTGQRSGTPTNAMFRFNSSNTKFEGYEGAWRDVITGVNGNVTNTRLVFGSGNSVVTGNDAFTVNTTSLSFQHAAGNFAVAGDAKTGQYVAKTSTTTNTPTELLINGAQRLVLANDSTWKFEVHVVARRTDADDESAAYTFQGCIDRNGSAATTALVGTVLTTVVAEDTAAWDVTVDADTTNGSLRIQVTGENAKTIRWVAFIRTVEVTG